MDHSGHTAQSSFTRKLKQIILDNLNNENFGVETLAKDYGTSRSNLHRKLKRREGKSVSQFIKEVRLEEALKMLLNEDTTVSEVAYRVGFHSPTYFNTCFKEHYGYPPGEAQLRETIINEDLPESNAKNDSKFLKRPFSYKEYTFIGILIIFLGLAFIFILNTYSNTELNSEINGSGKTADNKSIAVIPFNNLTGNDDLDYVGYGMTDAVISRLSQISSLERVIPYTSVKKYKNSTKSIPEIARELEVNNILQGNVHISGDKMKITLQLIDAKQNNPYWTSEYKTGWNMEELMKIQSEVTENIARKLNVSIDKEEKKLIDKIPTYNEEAYKNFLKAELLLTEFTKSAYEESMRYYQKAIELDPDFIEAYIGLANVWGLGGLFAGFFPEEMAWNNTKELMERAYMKDTTNLLVKQHISYGYFYYEWDFEKMERHFNDYFINPALRNSLFSYVADYAIKTGRPEKGLNVLNELILKNRSATYQYTKKADALYFLDRKKEALQFLRIGDSIFGDNPYHLIQSTKIYYYLGEHKIAQENLKKIKEASDFYSPIFLWLEAVYNEKKGESADVFIAELKKRYQSKAGGSPAWFLALYFSTQEDYDLAMFWLQKSFENHEVEMTWLREEPLLIPLKSDKRYQEIYQKMNWPVPLENSDTLNSFKN